jgi:epidermal growth factor receptor kinase substrate 8
VLKEEYRGNGNATQSDDDEASLLEGWAADLIRRGAHVVQVTYPRTANNEKELSVVRGEFLEVIDDSRKWWKARNARGQLGHVPHTIVAPYEGRGSPPLPPPPPPPMGHPHHHQLPPPPQTAEWIQKERRGRKGEFRYF